MTRKEKKKAYDAARYLSDPKKAEIRSRGWAKDNPEKKREGNRRWYNKNRERLKAKASIYYKKNKKKCKAYMQAYHKLHPEMNIAKHSKRRTRRLDAGGSFTASEWKSLCKRYHNRCLCCGKRRKLTADHVIPVSKGGTSNISNIQPLCGPCNSSKGTKRTDYRRRIPIRKEKRQFWRALRS